MRRFVSVVVLGLALTLGACGGGDDKKAASDGGGAPASNTVKASGNVTLWVGFAQRELGVIKSVVAEFEKKYPDIKVKTVGNVSDDKIIAAIRGGNSPDVAQSFSADNTGLFCSSGGWIDLADYMKRDGIDESIFPAAPREYTKFQGKRCSLPLLADVYGFYWNKKLFKQARLTDPPKTFSQLTEYAKKLTVKNPDGSLKVVGYEPMQGFYENAVAHYGPLFDAKWVDGDKSSIATSPGWTELLIDYYGYDKLVRWQSGAGVEFSPQNAFERGKLAMAMDGEFRTAFIKAEHPDLDYGTAPMPVSDSHPDLYGAGYTTGNIVGIPKGAKNKDAAWVLTKWLATDMHAQALRSNGLRNVPTTSESLKSSELTPDPQFHPFVEIFAHPKTATTPITPAGSANQELFQTFVIKYQGGKVSDLAGGLKTVDKNIDAQLAQSTGTQVP